MGIFDFFRRKKKSAGPHKNGDHSQPAEATRHCFVLCKAADPGDLSRASQIAAEVLGTDYSAVVDDDRIVSISILRRGSCIGILAHLPAPIPNQEAEQYADRNVLWPNGKVEAGLHRSHVIVTNLCGEEQTPIQSALEVTQLALIALRLFDGIGVYWGNAEATNSRETFETFCSDISEEHLPVPMWLRFQLVRANDKEVGLYTVGMNQFGLMEIEVDRTTMQPMELVQFVSNIANYLVQSGPVIADGNTVGGSEEQRILVRHRASMVDEGRRVYKIVFE